MKNLFYVFLILILGYSISANGQQDVTYDWPIYPRPEGKLITSTFGEYRPTGAEPHIHEGIDIPEGEDPVARVYSATFCFQVVDIDHDDHLVLIRHYYDDESAAISEGSRYLHLKYINPNLYENQIYTWTEEHIANAIDLYSDHLHFEIREPFDLVNSLNPFFNDSFVVNDIERPILSAVYADKSLYGKAEVEPWEYLGSNFLQYYELVSGGGHTFIKLILKTETPNNDWDDPHIIISKDSEGNRKTRFTVKVWDTAFGNISGPYTVEMYLNANVTAYPPQVPPIYNVQFDYLDNTDASSAAKDYHEEEDVYHVENPIISGMGEAKYYRLYPHDANDNGLPDVIINSDLLDTQNLEEGQHKIRIIAADWNSNMKTGDFHIYIRESEWVDYCRGFEDD